jgi:hypothetical protein
MLCAPWCQAAPRPLSGRAVPAGTITALFPTNQPVYHVQRAAKAPVIDGKTDDWKDVPAMALDKKEQSGGAWDGPADLSGTPPQWAGAAPNRGNTFRFVVLSDNNGGNVPGEWEAAAAEGAAGRQTRAGHGSTAVAGFAGWRPTRAGLDGREPAGPAGFEGRLRPPARRLRL